MNTRDVRIARTWARLETYIPYAWAQARGGSLDKKLRAAVHLAPRVAWLSAVRPYAAWKLRRERVSPAARPARVDVAAGQGLIPIPVLRSPKG
jgi:hypothetical protein